MIYHIWTVNDWMLCIRNMLAFFVNTCCCSHIVCVGIYHSIVALLWLRHIMFVRFKTMKINVFRFCGTCTSEHYQQMAFIYLNLFFWLSFSSCIFLCIWLWSGSPFFLSSDLCWLKCKTVKLLSGYGFFAEIHSLVKNCFG